MGQEIYPHPLLFTSARYQLDKLEAKVAAGEQDALTLDCMACLTPCAAAVESLVNFMGHKCVTGWDERANAPKKLKRLCSETGIAYDESTEPFASLAKLREFRNAIMHATPEVSGHVSFDETGHPDLSASWVSVAEPTFCRDAFDQAKAFQDSFFAALGIRAAEALSSAIYAYPDD